MMFCLSVIQNNTVRRLKFDTYQVLFSFLIPLSYLILYVSKTTAYPQNVMTNNYIKY